MTQLKIETDVYYQAATALAGGAQAWFAAIESQWKTSLWNCANMCGSYEEARAWATTYDTRTGEVLRLATDVAEAALNYARLLQEAGYIYAVAEHTATKDAGPVPARPPAIPAWVGACPFPLPSAGGDGQGLVASGLGLVEKIGLTVPDGDTTKLQNAANGWAAVAAAGDIAGFPDLLRRVAGEFDNQITAPEVAFIAHDLDILAGSSANTIAACAELSRSCTEHRAGLDDLRRELSDTLAELRDELLKELAITAGISIVASAVTFGAGAALGAARAAQIAAKFSAPLRAIIVLWKTKRMARSVKTETSLAQHAKELRRIKEMGTDAAKAPAAAPRALNQVDRDAIADYTGSAHQQLNGWLRHGDDLPPVVQDRVRELNSALDKLPDHQGPVTRITDLPPDVLARYRPGTPQNPVTVTEDAFTSSTPRGFPTERDGAVEMRILSQTGKDITPYSAPGNAEVVFKSGTKFDVIDRVDDFVSGRTIITMVERVS
ncbi:hypothetical protein [Nocardia brasiliensis]|uniref:hypothetical protein n=1 Tax=Nocardia brasiliensis TaxID=37326 RepID=UPI0024549428|nr:hypothetical protein [Nocardia brasiliensis]